MTNREKVLATIAASGFVLGVVMTVVYLLGLSIFSREATEWTLFFGLLAFGIGVLTLILKSVWEG